MVRQSLLIGVRRNTVRGLRARWSPWQRVPGSDCEDARAGWL